MATKAVAQTATDGQIVDAEIVDIPERRVSPDGQSIAIRTIFEDDTPGAVMAWLAVNARGITTYMSEAQVANWIKL